jgi:xanthine/uracil/vitamin C permease (AzgA family)
VVPLPPPPPLLLLLSGFIDDKARFPRRLITLCIDGVCILIGALMGTSPLTVVAESSVGIKEGGRTGGAVCCIACPNPDCCRGTHHMLH